MKTSTKFCIFGLSIVVVALTPMAWDVSLTMNALLYVLLWALLLTVVLIGTIVIQVKARPPWRLLAVTVALVLTCRACWQFSRITAIGKVQSEYVRGLRWFVGDLQEMTVAGRTNEVVRA